MNVYPEVGRMGTLPKEYREDTETAGFRCGRHARDSNCFLDFHSCCLSFSCERVQNIWAQKASESRLGIRPWTSQAKQKGKPCPSMAWSVLILQLKGTNHMAGSCSSMACLGKGDRQQSRPAVPFLTNLAAGLRCARCPRHWELASWLFSCVWFVTQPLT